MFGDSGLATYERQDVSLFAKTPAFPRKTIDPDNRQWQILRLQLEQGLYARRNWRLSWWSHWQKLAEAILPRRYHWLIVPNTMTRGLAINQGIIDPTATQALRVCTAGMRSGLMSSSRPWFRVKGPRGYTLDRDGKLWVEEVQARMYEVLATSNFYTAGTQMIEDLIVFGTAPMLIYEDMQTVINCFNPCAGEYYLGLGSDNRTNVFERTFVQTVSQLVERFTLANVGPEVQGLWEMKGANLETEFIVAHSIAPNFPLAAPGDQPNLGVIPGNFTWREYYWLWNRSSPRPLSARGFRSQPFIAPKWATTSNDPYGRSPGMDALPDILQLYMMVRRQNEAIEKKVRPPMQADVTMKSQPSSQLPGRVTFVPNLATSGGMKPIYEVKPDIAEMTALIEKIEQRIERWFYVDLFLMLDRMEGVQPRNELEIAERRGEKLLVLGPVVEGIEGELAAALRRVYAIMARRGLIPPKPESLQNVPLDIEIISMIAMAQMAAETAVMERVMGVAASMTQAYPDRPPTDLIDPDLYIREYAERTSFPMKILVSDTDVDAKREARAKQLQAEKNKADAAAMAQAAPQVASAAKDASEISVGGGLSALNLFSGAGSSLPQ